ncbi:hypothetical protein BaRGS_00006631 [Batillaria attramentaria]|uniref:Neurotransmitter-gated ion-channel ligand-binding domain-containing protein n=1 Tax=Batillaria attramentaria TaxID=370345 RepID=A0ABD0LSD1_9CAEN
MGMGRRMLLSIVAFVLFLDLPHGFVEAHPHESDVVVNLDHETHLYFHILDDHHYVKHLRPAASNNDSVLVDVEVALTAVNGLSWQDPRLKWNLTDFGGVKEVSVPASQLWTPHLHLLATSRGTFEVLDGKHAMVRHDGSVTWLCDVMVRALCAVDLSDFPFDAQTCSMELGSGTHIDDAIHVHISQAPPGSAVHSSEGHVDTSLAGEWVLLQNETRPDDLALVSKTVKADSLSLYPYMKASCLCLEQMSETADHHHGLAVTVRLGRRSQLYQCLMVGPVVLLALLVPCVFLLPADSTAKITLGALLQVSICICLRTLCDMLHHNHGSVPSIAIFSIASLALTSISIIMAALVMSLASRGAIAKPVPSWLSTTFLGRCGLRRWLCMDQYLPVERQPPFASLKNGNDTLEADADAASLKGSDSEAKEITRSLRVMLGRYSAEQAVVAGGGEWREIARVVDRLLFVVFVILFMLTSISLLS